MAKSKKTILLMRHAKSSWDDSSLRDFDRPLNSRGKRDAPRMGLYLSEIGTAPDLIVCSPAARAKATILRVVKELGLNEDVITWEEDLYFGGSDSYLNAIRRAPENAQIVMTVGHNPMTESAIASLSDKSFNEHVPTATIACLETEVESWSDVSVGSCKLKWLVSPKKL
jgi:phosphohistidine phosphatase